jgi:hypothetical protein
VALLICIVCTSGPSLACGGSGGEEPLSWVGVPVLTATPAGDRILAGKLKNGAEDDLRLEAPKVKVLDQDGRPISSAAVFLASFVRSNYPHNVGPRASQERYPESEKRRVGYVAVVPPAASTPITVSWHEPPGPRTAKRIVAGPVSLPVPATPGSRR